MADKVSWISFILTKRAPESQLADAEGGKTAVIANVIIKYLCCRQMPNALTVTIIPKNIIIQRKTQNVLDIYWDLAYL